MKKHIKRLKGWWLRRQDYHRKVAQGREWAHRIANGRLLTYDSLWKMYQADTPFAHGVREAVIEYELTFW
jgi:hypothetical protein